MDRTIPETVYDGCVANELGNTPAASVPATDPSVSKTDQLPVKKPVSPFWLILLAAVLLSGIAAGVGYYVGKSRNKPVSPPVSTPSPLPTITSFPLVTPAPSTATGVLKTYTDTDNGFSFQYPASWQESAVPTAKGTIVLTSPSYVPIMSGSVQYRGEIYVMVIQNPNDTPIKDVFATFNDTSALWFKNFSYQEFNLPLPGVKFPLIDEGGGRKRTEYIFKLNKRIVDMAYIYTTPSVMGEFDAIAASMKQIALPPNPLDYSNSQYGFTLTFPQTWTGFTVSSGPGPSMVQQIHFTVKSPVSGSLPVFLMNIYIFTKDQWNALGKKPQLITQNSTYVFATDPAIPPPDDCVQLDAFQCARNHEIPSIVQTFRLTN